jgi:hypothetical protein
VLQKAIKGTRLNLEPVQINMLYNLFRQIIGQEVSGHPGIAPGFAEKIIMRIIDLIHNCLIGKICMLVKVNGDIGHWSKRACGAVQKRLRQQVFLRGASFAIVRKAERL